MEFKIFMIKNGKDLLKKLKNKNLLLNNLSVMIFYQNKKVLRLIKSENLRLKVKKIKKILC